MQNYIKKGVAVIITDKKDNVLLTKRSLLSRDQPGKWENPGGEVDGNETPRQAIAREIKEELGVDLKVEKVFYIDKFETENYFWKITVFFGSINGTPQVMKSDETSKLGWFKKKDLSVLDLASYTRRDFSKLGWV